MNPAELLTPYAPLDDEGNPWWSPPDRDFWEGGAWDVCRPPLQAPLLGWPVLCCLCCAFRDLASGTGRSCGGVRRCKW